MPASLRRHTPALLAAAALLGALTASCASNSGPGRTKIGYQERPVEIIYNAAAASMDAGYFDDAVLYFREVERQHPYSVWAKRAVLMSAYSNYRAANAGSSAHYADAVADAERFAQLNPADPAAAYAYYLRAICYFEQIVDVGRDQGSTESAQTALRDVIQRFPNTPYAADARLKLDMVSDQLAGKEMTIGRWYLNQGSTIAAIGRFKTVIDRYQTTNHTPEALHRLVEAYLTLGMTEEAKRNAAVLGHNFPGDPWYFDTYELMTGRGMRPAQAPTGDGRKLRNLFGLLPTRAQPAKPGPALPPPATL